MGLQWINIMSFRFLAYLSYLRCGDFYTANKLLDYLQPQGPNENEQENKTTKEQWRKLNNKL